MNIPLPECWGDFRLHRGEILFDVKNSRELNESLWERMKKENVFQVEWRRGFHELPETTGYEFPLCEFLLAQNPKDRLSQILGHTIKVVTQRDVLTNILYNILEPTAGFGKQFACERFGDYIFIKEFDQIRLDSDVLYLDRRKEFFQGDDLPDCIGSTPVEEFNFPDVGKPYRVLTLKHEDSRILYSCPLTQFASDGEPVESTVNYSESSFSTSYTSHLSMIAKALTNGFKHNSLFKISTNGTQTEFPNIDKILRDEPMYHESFQKALGVLLDKRLFAFLADRRCCIATLEWNPDLRLRPSDIPPHYKSFLSQDFFLRFFDDEE